MLEKQFFKAVLRFFLPPRLDITSLTYPDGFRQAHAIWLCETRQDGLSAPSPCCEKVFRSYPVWKTSLFTKRSLLMPHAFAFRLFFPKRKVFADIHRNVGLVRSVMIRQRRIRTATSQLSHGPLGAYSARHHKLPKCSPKRLRVTGNRALYSKSYTKLSVISRRIQFSLQNSCIVYCARDIVMETQ